MPELQFQIEGAEAVAHAAAPLLALKLRIRNIPADGDDSHPDAALPGADRAGQATLSSATSRRS